MDEAVEDGIGLGADSELGLAQPDGGALGVAAGDLALDEQGEAIFEDESAEVGVAALVFEGLGYADQAEAVEFWSMVECRSMGTSSD